VHETTRGILLLSAHVEWLGRECVMDCENTLQNYHYKFNFVPLGWLILFSEWEREGEIISLPCEKAINSEITPNCARGRFFRAWKMWNARICMKRGWLELRQKLYGPEWHFWAKFQPSILWATLIRGERDERRDVAAWERGYGTKLSKLITAQISNHRAGACTSSAGE
jgi:hypothetical protein